MLLQGHHKAFAQPRHNIVPLGGGDEVLWQQHKKGRTCGHGVLTPLLALTLSLLSMREAWLHPVLDGRCVFLDGSDT